MLVILKPSEIDFPTPFTPIFEIQYFFPIYAIPWLVQPKAVKKKKLNIQLIWLEYGFKVFNNHSFAYKNCCEVFVVENTWLEAIEKPIM